MPENIEEVKRVFYNASIKLLEAGSDIMTYNHPLGVTIVKIAEGLSQEIDIFSGNNTCNTKNQNVNKIDPKLSDEMIQEIEALEEELANDLEL